MLIGEIADVLNVKQICRLFFLPKFSGGEFCKLDELRADTYGDADCSGRCAEGATIAQFCDVSYT